MTYTVQKEQQGQQVLDKYNCVSVFYLPVKNSSELARWTQRTLGRKGGVWDEVRCDRLIAGVTIAFTDIKHKHRFDLFARLNGIAVYDTMDEYAASRGEL